MIYYADYEALEFENAAAEKEGIYPYYLNSNITEKSLCPIFFSVCNAKSGIVCRQNAYKQKISFLRFLDKEISRLQRLEHKTMFVWFHNVQYDFRIIAHELFYNDFINIVDSEKITYIGEYQTEQDKAFSIIGENLSKYIGINLYYRGFKIMIRDTMSILNSAQDKILTDFGYPKKIDVDWQAITIETLKSHMPLIEERNIYDITSLAKCIEEFKAVFFEKFHGKGSTAAGMSLDALKHFLCVTAGMLESDINYESKNEFFRECYPMLSGINKEISDGTYHGGICTLNPKYGGIELERLQMVDINSSYPYSMTMPLPYGEGKQITGFCDTGYSDYVVYIEFKHKGIPFQRCHSENRAREIMGFERKKTIHTRSQFPAEYKGYICINSIDLDTLKRHAKVTTLDFCKGVNYKTNTIIADFIIPIYEERKLSKGVLKLAIKLLLNSLYGKYAQDLSGVIFQYLTMEDYTKVIAIDNDTLYKPFASAVTAYSRQNWVDTVYLLGDNFIYGDTDSIYFNDIERCTAILEEAGKIHPNELGKWAFDDDYGEFITRGKFLSKKNYILDLHGKIKVTCVGLSHKYHNQVNFENFIIKSIPFEVYKMVNVYGGKAMRKTEFVIRERVYF